MAKTESEHLEDLKKSIAADGVTVWEKSIQDFVTEASARGGAFSPNADTTAGALYFDTTLYADGTWAGWPTPIIVLDSVKSEIERYRSGTHEWGHHKCRSGGCVCSNPDYFHPLAEVHAHQFAIDYLTKERPELVDVYVLGLMPECTYFFSQPQADTHLLGALDALLIIRHTDQRGVPAVPASPTQDDHDNLPALNGLRSQVPLDRLKQDAEKAARDCAGGRLAEVLKFINA